MKIYVTSSDELNKCIKNIKENTQIILKEGEYELCETVKIESDNVSICGENSKVIIKGSRKVYFDNCKKNEMIEIDLVKNNIKSDIEFPQGPFDDYWFKYDIPKPHLTQDGPPISAFYAEKLLNQGRYPKSGTMYIKNALGKTDMFFQKTCRNGSEEGIIIPSDSFVFDNDNKDNLFLIGCWNADWAMHRHVIESYDRETKIIRIKEPYHSFGYRDGRSFTEETGGKFYVLNSKSAVTDPGDWYIDISKNAIYIIPFENQNYVEISNIGNVFEAKGVKNITIKNVTICQMKKSGIEFEDCENCVIDNVTVKNAGAWGIIADNSNNITVNNCCISYTAGGGISCCGGDRNKLISSNNVVSKNEIHHTAFWHKMCMAGIEMNGVGVKATENYIHDVPNSAIMYQGNNHIIEKNRIEKVCCESNDAGAVYAGRDYTCQGTIIRYNCFSNLLGFEGNGCVGIYFDDGMCTAEVYKNILINVPYVAILLGGGRNFDIHDNYFYNCRIALMFDERLNKWSGGNKRLVEHLSDVPYRSEIWKNTYPSLYNILEDEPCLPKYNKFNNNTIIGGEGLAIFSFETSKYLDYNNNAFINDTVSREHISHLNDWYYINKNE